MAITNKLFDWESSEDDVGNVDVTVTWLCVTTTTSDGPETIRLNAGLPQAGDAYVIGSESTAYFYARRPKKAKRVSSNPSDKRRWYVTQIFSTRPLTRFDASGPIADPLLEPPEITGSALKYMRRFTKDRNGDPLLMSNGERMAGPEVEDDDNNLSIAIEFNVATVDLVLLRSVLKFSPWNNATLWGLSTRTVRFTDFTVKKMYKGDGTEFYRISLKFEIGGDFAKEVLDEGYMEYIGRKVPQITAPQEVVARRNPKNYARVKDGRGENAAKLPLDGAGNVLPDTATPFFHDVELKGDSNLLLLGIPATI
jgi:hypothetical protein